MNDTHEGLRAWAKGIYPREAGVELLIRTGMADRLGGSIIRLPDDPGPTTAEAFRWVDTDALVDALDGPWSGGERRVLAIATSLLHSGHGVNLSDALPGLDRNHVALVLAAVAHAGGSHEHSGWEPSETGRLRMNGERGSFVRLETLHPWPS